MKEKAINEIKDELDLIIYRLKNNACNVDTKEKGWETYYGLDNGLIDYIRKIEKTNLVLQSKIDKAIKYIDLKSNINGYDKNKLENILKGEDK